MTFIRRGGLGALALTATLLGANRVDAQPFGAWLTLAGHPSQTYVEIPHAPALNTPTGFTFEAWVSISNNATGEDCRSIAGKGYKSTWWIGVCNASGTPTLRSYLQGSASARTGGALTRNTWLHIAVVYDKAAGKRRHYVNGLQVAEFAETGNLPTNAKPVRIGSDVDWQFSPAGAIDEVRLWKVARTQTEIRKNLNLHFTAPKPTGLIAQWSLDANGNDTFGKRNGVVVGGGFLTFPAGPPCTSGPASGNFACLSNRFSVGVSARNGGTVTQGTVTLTNNGDSALFSLFSPENFQVVTKVVNACSTHARYWIIATDIGAQAQVTAFDTKAFQQRIYFFYPDGDGVVPSIVDPNAFATCP